MRLLFSIRKRRQKQNHKHRQDCHHHQNLHQRQRGGLAIGKARLHVGTLRPAKTFVQKKSGPNLCSIYEHLWLKKRIPALQFGRLDYIAPMRQLRNFTWTLTALVVLALAVYLTFTAASWLNHGSSRFFWNTTSVVHEVQSLSDLVTVKYVLNKVVVLEDVKWYGENRVLLLAQGVVKAGIDLKKLKPEDVSIAGKKISLRLPPPQITDAYLDDQASQVIDHTTGLLRAFDKDLEQSARQQAVDDVARAARHAGILDEADKRGRLELENFFKRAGFEVVEFR